MLSNKLFELDEQYEIVNDEDIEEYENEEDLTLFLLHNVSISPESLNLKKQMNNQFKENILEESVNRNSDSGIRSLSSLNSEDELENIDETRVYTAVEWELLQTLMKVL